MSPVIKARHSFKTMARQNQTRILELPRVNPVGLMESPDSYETSPRKLPMALRIVAATILVAFTAVGTITTVVSLGAYCLTSHAGAPPPLLPNR